MKKCIICKKSFNPQFSTLERCCKNYECRVEFALKVAEKQRKQAETTRKKEWKEQKKDLKGKTVTLTELKSEAKRVFQKWIRLRDSDKPCISCGVKNTELWDGGHYKKAELYSGVIFNEMNVHKQCRKCNRFLGGNELNYRVGLINRYSLEVVEKLENLANETKTYKWSKDELKAKKLQYEIKIKEFKNN